jgi:hypothetical protein
MLIINSEHKASRTSENSIKVRNSLKEISLEKHKERLKEEKDSSFYNESLNKLAKSPLRNNALIESRTEKNNKVKEKIKEEEDFYLEKVSEFGFNVLRESEILNLSLLEEETIRKEIFHLAKSQKNLLLKNENLKYLILTYGNKVDFCDFFPSEVLERAFILKEAFKKTLKDYEEKKKILIEYSLSNDKRKEKYAKNVNLGILGDITNAIIENDKEVILENIKQNKNEINTIIFNKAITNYAILETLATLIK